MVVVIGGDPTATTATGPTALEIRNGIARDFMWWLETVVSAIPAAGEAARVVLADALRDDEAGYEAAGLSWLYARTGAQAGTARRVIGSESGHLGPHGAVTVSRPFAAPLAAATVIDATGPLPMRQVGMVMGLHECMNEGLARIWVEARIALGGTGSAYAHDLAAYPWLTRDEQTRGIYDAATPAGPGSPGPRSPYPYELRADGATRTLVTSVSYAARPFELAVLVRADRLIHDGAAWSYAATPGLKADADMAACPLEWAVRFGVERACRHARMQLRRAGMDPEIKAALLAEVADRHRAATAAAASIALREMPRPVADPQRGLAVGPRDGTWP